MPPFELAGFQGLQAVIYSSSPDLFIQFSVVQVPLTMLQLAWWYIYHWALPQGHPSHKFLEVTFICASNRYNGALPACLMLVLGGGTWEKQNFCSFVATTSGED